MDPRDFVAALEAGIFEVPLSIYTAVVDELERNFLPSINLVSIANPIPIGIFTPNTNRPIMTSFDIDLSTSIVRFHFNSIMDLSTFSSPFLTLTNGEATLILDRTSRPIGIETNLVKTVCVTLSDNDARELWMLGICNEPYGRCSCYFTADLMSDYSANTIEDIGSQNPIQVIFSYLEFVGKSHSSLLVWPQEVEPWFRSWCIKESFDLLLPPSLPPIPSSPLTPSTYKYTHSK